MRNRSLYRYDKIYYCLLVLLFNQFCFGQNNFPYFNTGQTKDGFRVLAASKDGNAVNDLVTFNDNGIRLVNATGQFAGVALEGLTFSTTKGFILEFEFGLDSGSSKPGDGIAMVLYDGSLDNTNTNMGDKGGALGYAHTIKKYANENVKGFSKGFLGLGLDLYGNYKNIRDEDSETRNGLLKDADGNYVVLRGPYNSTEEYRGYPVLFAINTERNYNYYLNRLSGSREEKKRGFEGQRFEIKGGKLNAKPGETEYRKAIISMVPGEELNTTNQINERGFFISVSIVNGIYTSVVIKNYFLPIAGTIKFTEYTNKSTAISSTMDITVPSTLKMAFTGSTGAAFIQAHIRNIALSLPFSPVANDMSVQGVLVDVPSLVKPLYSAFGYNSNVYSVLNPPTKSVLYLDKKSFRFKKYDPVTKQPVLTPDKNKLVAEGVGTFTYDENTGEVTFTPVADFNGKDPYTFYYDIKNLKLGTGADLSTDEYRSRTAAVTLNFIKKGTGVDAYPSIIVNRGIKNTKEQKK